MRSKAPVFAAAAWFAATAPVGVTASAAGAPRLLEEVVVTGTKLEGVFGEKSGIPLRKMSQSVQIISSQEIAEQGARSIGDLLRAVPSADPGYSRVGPWQASSLKIRGFLADQIRNGMRQRYYEDVDASALSNIERVEVLKGPSGVLYGQSAVGGIVSIVTKRPLHEFGASTTFGIGSFSQKTASFDITGGLGNGFAARAIGEIERSDTFVDHQSMDRNNAAVSLLHQPNEIVAMHLVAEYAERRTRRHAGLPVLGTVQSNGVTTLDRSLDLGEPSIAGLNAHAPLLQAWVDIGLSESWSLTPRAQYQEFNTQFGEIRVRDPLPGSATTFARSGRFGREEDEYYIAQLDLAGTLQTGAVAHRVLAGFEYGVDRGSFAQSNLVNVGPIDALNPSYTYDAIAPTAEFAYSNLYDVDGHALYVQDLIALNERLDVVAAVRRSWIEAADKPRGAAAANRTKVTSTIWQLGATYTLTPVVSAYAGFNTGFDIESTAGARTAHGRPLEPEESKQVEAGLRFTGTTARGSVSLFEIRRVNALTTDPNNPDFSVNAGEQRVRGIEFEGEWRPLSYLALQSGYAYLDGEITRSNDGDEGLRIGDVPQHNFNARVSLQIPGTALSLRAGAVYVSERALVNGSDIDLPSYVLADFGASYRFKDVWIDAYVANLFDEEYFTASGNRFNVLPGDPRTFGMRVGMSW